jgi:hypothetical protein
MLSPSDHDRRVKDDILLGRSIEPLLVGVTAGSSSLVVLSMATLATGDEQWDIETLTLPCMNADHGTQVRTRSETPAEASRRMGHPVLSR